MWFVVLCCVECLSLGDVRVGDFHENVPVDLDVILRMNPIMSFSLYKTV